MPIRVCQQSDRPAWLEARREGIGASECPAVLGLSPFETEASLAQRKAGLAPEIDESNLMKWGQLLEPAMLEAFLDEVNEDVVAPGEASWFGELDGNLWRHHDPDRSFMLATFDGRLVKPSGERGLCEMKLKRFGASEWREYGVPDHVEAQAQHQMEVADVDFCVILVLLDPFDLRWKEIKRDRYLMDEVILPAEREWWRKYQAGEAFDFSKGRATDANTSALRAMWPSLKLEETVRLEGVEWVKRISEWRECGEKRRAYAGREKSLKNGILAAMEDKPFAVLDDGTKLKLQDVHMPAHERKASVSRRLAELKPKGR